MNVHLSHQRGAVLLVSLVLLLVMTLLGISAMESSGTQMKMTSVTKDRQQAFEMAEQVLSVVERQIEGRRFEDQTALRDCASGSNICFDDTCAGGLCFDGVNASGADMYLCVRDGATLNPVNIWDDDANWADANKHIEFDIPSANSNPKYMIEFLCYVDQSAALPLDSGSPNDGAPYFRITARAVSDSGKSEVMLQSTYRWNGVEL